MYVLLVHANETVCYMTFLVHELPLAVTILLLFGVDFHFLSFVTEAMMGRKCWLDPDIRILSTKECRRIAHYAIHPGYRTASEGKACPPDVTGVMNYEGSWVRMRFRHKFIESGDCFWHEYT